MRSILKHNYNATLKNRCELWLITYGIIVVLRVQCRGAALPRVARRRVTSWAPALLLVLLHTQLPLFLRRWKYRTIQQYNNNNSVLRYYWYNKQQYTRQHRVRKYNMHHIVHAGKKQASIKLRNYVEHTIKSRLHYKQQTIKGLSVIKC